MKTDGLNALIAQAESGDIAAMNQLTHIYAKRGENTAALKWFRILLREENDPKSKFYHNTKYDKALCEKIVGTIENAISDIKVDNIQEESASGTSLFSNAVVFISKQAQSDIHIIREIWAEAEKKAEELNAEIKRIENGFSRTNLIHKAYYESMSKYYRQCGRIDLLLELQKEYKGEPNPNKRKKSFVIPTGVKKNGDYFFYDCTNLVTIKLPESLKSIGVKCFEGCIRLKSIIVPKGTKQKFAQMKGLKEYASIIVEE